MFILGLLESVWWTRMAIAATKFPKILYIFKDPNGLNYLPLLFKRLRIVINSLLNKNAFNFYHAYSRKAVNAFELNLAPVNH